MLVVRFWLSNSASLRGAEPPVSMLTMPTKLSLQFLSVAEFPNHRLAMGPNCRFLQHMIAYPIGYTMGIRQSNLLVLVYTMHSFGYHLQSYRNLLRIPNHQKKEQKHSMRHMYQLLDTDISIYAIVYQMLQFNASFHLVDNSLSPCV